MEIFQRWPERFGISLYGGGGPEPAWWQPIADALNSSGNTGFLWLYDEGTGATTGQPVASWMDVTGTIAWAQAGASSIRPQLDVNGLVWDGIDDRMNGPSEVSVILSNLTWSVGIGVQSNLPSGTRFYWSITDNSVSNIAGLTTLHRMAFAPSATIFTSASESGPLSIWTVRDDLGFDRRLSTAESTRAIAAYPVSLNTPTLGARRSPTSGLFFQGSISWVMMTTRKLTSSDMLAIETILNSNGYPT